jgi:hypothetical protein
VAGYSVVVGTGAAPACGSTECGFGHGLHPPRCSSTLLPSVPLKLGSSRLGLRRGHAVAAHLGPTCVCPKGLL